MNPKIVFHTTTFSIPATIHCRSLPLRLTIFIVSAEKIQLKIISLQRENMDISFILDQTNLSMVSK